jgi:hypothetical protein
MAQLKDEKLTIPSNIGGFHVDHSDQAAALAAATTEDAIRTLLGESKEVWGKLLGTLSDEAIYALTGGVREFGRAIPRGFVIPREVVQQIVDRLSAGGPIEARSMSSAQTRGADITPVTGPWTQ